MDFSRKRRFDDAHSPQQQTHDATSMSETIFAGCGSPPWEVLSLVSDYMDDKTLAVASSVSKTWNLCLSSDHLWQSLCTTRHPSLSAVKTNSPEISYTHLYSVAESAAKRRRLVKQAPKPKISLPDLTFIVHVRSSDMDMTVVKHGKDIAVPSDGLFRFNIDVNHQEGSSVSAGEMTESRVTWNVVLREWESVFTMTDCIRSLEKSKWFREELPAPEYCIFSRGSGLAADVNMELTGENQAVNIGLGIMNTVDWRYLNLDDGLRYLERFLLPQGRE